MALDRRSLPPLTTLVAFEAAARLGSFTAAAREVHLTQAAVSRQMRTLESDLGCALFVRGRRCVSLTAAGHELLRAVELSLGRLGGAAEDIRAQVRGRPLQVFCEFGLATGWLIPRLFPFLVANPDISVRLTTSDEPIEHFSRGFDLGLQTGRWPAPGLSVHPLDSEEAFPVCAPGHHPKLTRHSPASALLGARLLDVEWERDWAGWPQLLAAAGVTETVRPSPLRFNNYPVLLHATKLGYGVAIAWSHAVAHELAAGTLVRVTDAVIRYEDGVCAYLPEHPEGPAGEAQRLLAFLAGSAKTPGNDANSGEPPDDRVQVSSTESSAPGSH